MDKKELKALKDSYTKLPLEEKVRRLEVIAAHYAAWLNSPDHKNSAIVDATKYWGLFEREISKSACNA